MNHNVVEIYFDGACQNHSGKYRSHFMGVGVCARHQGEWIVEKSFFAGKNHHSMTEMDGTSNIAEWTGLVLSLELITILKQVWPNLMYKIYSDSQLIVNQFNGHWMVKKPHFKYYEKMARALDAEVGNSLGSVSWIRRNKNERADMLSKLALTYSEEMLKKETHVREVISIQSSVLGREKWKEGQKLEGNQTTMLRGLFDKRGG